MANNSDGNESHNDVKRARRRYSAEEKRRLLNDAEKPGESVSTVARRYVAPSLFFGWRKAMEAGATTGLAVEEPLVPASEVKALKAQIRELAAAGAQDAGERGLEGGRRDHPGKKTGLARQIAEEGRLPVKVIVT